MFSVQMNEMVRCIMTVIVQKGKHRQQLPPAQRNQQKNEPSVLGCSAGKGFRFQPKHANNLVHLAV